MGYPVCVCTCTIYCLALTYQLHQIYYVRFLICIYNPANKYQYSLWYLILTPLGVPVTLKCNLCTRHLWHQGVILTPLFLQCTEALVHPIMYCDINLGNILISVILVAVFLSHATFCTQGVFVLVTQWHKQLCDHEAILSDILSTCSYVTLCTVTHIMQGYYSIHSNTYKAIHHDTLAKYSEATYVCKYTALWARLCTATLSPCGYTIKTAVLF